MTPKTEAERIDEWAFENSKQYLHSKIIAIEAFKEGVAWRDANPIEIDDHEQFEKDIQEHVDQHGSFKSAYFTNGWRKCRDYKFKLNLKDANQLPHPDAEYFTPEEKELLHKFLSRREYQDQIKKLKDFIKNNCLGFVEGIDDDAVPVMTAMSQRAEKLLKELK